MNRLMLVDDDENILKAMRRALRAQGYEIEMFRDPADALERAAEVEFDLAIVDYRMPRTDGARFLEKFRQIQPDAYRILASAFDDVELFRNAINRAQIQKFIPKPWDVYVLLDSVAQGVEQSGLHRQLTALKRELEEKERLLAEQQMFIDRIRREHPEWQE